VLTTERGSIPLYMQIKELLLARISRGDWMPGNIIPSEMQLAQELKVSQGTVRKAISELVENNILTRKQGRGTFVSNHDSQRSLFHFFHIVDDDDHKVLPESTVLHCRRKPASRLEALKLHLEEQTKVIIIERVRNIGGKPIMLETITLPEALFDDLGKKGDCNLPNMLYELYENQFGITIHSADEKLRAVTASKLDSERLNLKVGTPLLEIERVALTLNKDPVELRISRCSTTHHHYQNTFF